MLTRIIRYQTLPSRSHHQALLFYQSCCFLKIASIASNKMCWKGKPGSGSIMASVLGICSVNNNNNQQPTTNNQQQQPTTTTTRRRTTNNNNNNNKNHQQPPTTTTTTTPTPPTPTTPLFILSAPIFFRRFSGSQAGLPDRREDPTLFQLGVFLRKKNRYQNDHVIGVFWGLYQGTVGRTPNSNPWYLLCSLEILRNYNPYIPAI